MLQELQAEWRLATSVAEEQSETCSTMFSEQTAVGLYQAATLFPTYRSDDVPPDAICNAMQAHGLGQRL